MIDHSSNPTTIQRCCLCGANRIGSLILAMGFVCLFCQFGEPDLTNEIPGGGRVFAVERKRAA